MAAKKKTSKTTAKRKTTTAKRKTTAKRPAAKSKTVKRAVKKTTAKRTTTAKRAAAPAKKAVKRSTTPVKKAYTKSQVATEIAELVGITRKQVSDVFAELGNVIERHVKKGGAGSFNMPGLMKITTVRKKATKARKGVNPFTGEACVFKAKPARTVVKVRALKGLKDMV